MFVVLEYFKVPLAQKPINLPSSFQSSVILHVVYMWEWEGGEGQSGHPHIRKCKSAMQTIRFLSNGTVFNVLYIILQVMLNMNNR